MALDVRKFHTLDAEKTFKTLNSSPLGLSSSEAGKRLTFYGPNEIPHKKTLAESIASAMNSINSFLGIIKIQKLTLWVMRDMTESLTPKDEIVPGDIIMLSEGDTVPADGRIIESDKLTVDESNITGAAESSEKNIMTLPDDTPLPKRANMVYMNSKVIRGSGKVVITSTGKRTEVAKKPQEIKADKT